MLDLLVFGLFMWAVIEMVRRAAIAAWRSHRANQFGRTITQYQAYKRDLRGREDNG